MFTQDIQYTEARNSYLIAKGAHAISFDVVTKFEDRLYMGQVFNRRVINVTVEGDLPMTIKGCIAGCLKEHRFKEASRWVENYLDAVIAADGASMAEVVVPYSFAKAMGLS